MVYIGQTVIIKKKKKKGNAHCKVDFYYHLWLQCCPLIPKGSLMLRYFFPWLAAVAAGSINWIAVSSAAAPAPAIRFLLFILHAARVSLSSLFFYSARLIIYNTTGPGSTRLLSWSKRKENGLAVYVCTTYTPPSFRNLLLYRLPSLENSSSEKSPRHIIFKMWSSWLRSRKREVQLRSYLDRRIISGGEKEKKVDFDFLCSDVTSRAKITRLSMLLLFFLSYSIGVRVWLPYY